VATSWLDPKDIGRLCLALVGLQLLVAILNLAFIPSERREYLAWQTHIEAPAPTRPRAAAAEPTGPVRWRVELVRLARQQLDLDRECNFATWLSSVQAGMVGFVSVLLFLQSRRREWWLVGLGWMALSADELCQFHEWTGAIISRSGFHLGALGPPYPWVIVAGPFLLAYAVVVLWFLNRELRPHPRLRGLVLLALLLMASSLPLEVIGGWIQGNAPRPPRLEVIAEETFESLGGTVFLYVLLVVLAVGLRRSAGERAAAPG
jgi:hypothetical protein